MLPILISVSVAPVSYFFCASAPLEDTANKAKCGRSYGQLSGDNGHSVSPSISHNVE